MSRYTVIDPTQLGVLEALEKLDAETILSDRMARFKEVWASYDPPYAAQYDVETLEFDPIKIDQETDSLFELLLRSRINQAVRETTLAMATGNNLAGIASRYPGGVPRVDDEIILSTDSPVEAAIKDARYRRRIWLSPNGLSPHGTGEAYTFWALTAAPELRDATAIAIRTSPEREPTVILTCMADNTADPRPTREQLLAVHTYVHDEGRKGLTDVVNVVGPAVIDVDLDFDLWLYPNANESTSIAAVNSALDTLLESKRWLGEDFTLMAFSGALAQIGVQNAVIRSPAADVRVSPRGVVRVQSRRLTVRGRAE